MIEQPKSKIEKFFPEWNKVDETCPLCANVTHQQKGITRQNMKKLTKWSWSINDLILFFVLIMLVFLAWRYTVETKECRTFANELKTNPYMICAELTKNVTNAAKGLNISGLWYNQSVLNSSG